MHTTLSSQAEQDLSSLYNPMQLQPRFLTRISSLSSAILMLSSSVLQRASPAGGLLPGTSYSRSVAAAGRPRDAGLGHSQPRRAAVVSSSGSGDSAGSIGVVLVDHGSRRRQSNELLGDSTLNCTLQAAAGSIDGRTCRRICDIVQRAVRPRDR